MRNLCVLSNMLSCCYHRVPTFSPYGSVCCECAQRPGLPGLLAHAEVTKTYFVNGSKTKVPAGTATVVISPISCLFSLGFSIRGAGGETGAGLGELLRCTCDCWCAGRDGDSGSIAVAGQCKPLGERCGIGGWAVGDTMATDGCVAAAVGRNREALRDTDIVVLLGMASTGSMGTGTPADAFGVAIRIVLGLASWCVLAAVGERTI